MGVQRREIGNPASPRSARGTHLVPSPLGPDLVHGSGICRPPAARRGSLCGLYLEVPDDVVPLRAEVAELADAQASGACGRKVVEVQILSSANQLIHCRREVWAGAEASDVGTLACVSSSALCNGCATAGR